MTVRPPFMVLCQCNTPAEAREREAAAGCSACLEQAAVGLRKGLTALDADMDYLPGRKLFVFLRENGILPKRGWVFFKKWE